ncbi:type VI secretion system baseplate subunit TssG [Dyadobacter sp. MSC1_007]|jgi:hypothetical protein|uniref:type VI secretion system baseplate subunit TssG n=1 Tax=Dyadobacter sp. MSC1_007 TaxID=2909264 RepID=UPI00202FC70D|nr:type VI secretion system baseplate subunit TssG [Dyadobacter sp. MSC1_007]
MEPRPDLKAEFIASSLLEDGRTADQILFRALGGFKRRSHRDVETTREVELGNFKGEVIESNRSGIYDYLPEQLFHLPSSNSINTLKKKVDEIRFQREKEQKSRLFFLPLEQEFFLNRVTLTRIEQTAWELAADSGMLNELKSFWQAPDSLDPATFVQLLGILPFVSENRGNLNVASGIISNALRLPVTIKEVPGIKYRLESAAGLNDMSLGADAALGGEVDTYLPRIIVAIEMPDPAALETYIHNEVFETTVNWLIGWFIPVEYDYEVSLELAPGSAPLCLPTEDGYAARLGYASLEAI